MRFGKLASTRAASVALAVALAAAALSGNAFAHRGGYRGGHGGGHGGGVWYGIHLGVPLYWPWYYSPYYAPYSPYYYPPAVVTVPHDPPVYIERADEYAAPGPADYWYYCDQAKAYYPYVKDCPGGWRKVLPQPRDE
jgi:hypothetical protein